MKSIIYLMWLAIAMHYNQLTAQVCDSEIISKEFETAIKQDQDIRKEIMPIVAEYQKTGKGAEQLIALTIKMNQIDDTNQKTITKWVELCGWPDDLTEEAHNAAFLILQHADIDLISRYIPMVKEKVDKDLLAPDDYAIMFDRKAMYERKLQRFGTQTFQSPNGLNLVWPVENIDSLNTWRANVGLPTMQQYFKLAQDSMGIIMKLDSALTLKQAIDWQK